MDFLGRRSEFVPAANILDLAIKDKLDVYITNLTVANTIYIMRKDLGKDQTKAMMQQLCKFIKIAPSTQIQTDQAFNTENPDFEDALQYFSAVAIGAEAIITRDPKHFTYSEIPVMNCSEWLKTNLP